MTVETVKLAFDTAAIGTAFATLVGLLPTIASLFSVIWLGIQIYEWYKKKKD